MKNCDSRACVEFSTVSRDGYDRLFSSFFAHACSQKVLAGFPVALITAPSNTAKSFGVDIAVSCITGNSSLRSARRHSCLEEHSDQAVNLMQKQFITAAGDPVAIQFTNLLRGDLVQEDYDSLNQILRLKFPHVDMGMTFLSNPKSREEQYCADVSISYDFAFPAKDKTLANNRREDMWVFDGEIRCNPEIASQQQLQELVHSYI